MALSKDERKEKLGRGAARQIAVKVGKSRSHVCRVLLGERADRDVEVVAARKLRVPVRDAFPEYYDRKSA